MTLDRRSGPPLYQQLAEQLRHDISAGRYPPGVDLPSEARLAYDNKVGKPTVRRALAVLRAQGLIATERGSPSFVRRPAPRHDLVLCRNDKATVRMPNEVERQQLDLDQGVPIVEVHRHDGGRMLLSADGLALYGG